MKTLKKYIIITSLCILNSCGSDFGDLNVDPNNPQEVPPESILTGVEKNLADNTIANITGLLLAQSWAANNYTGFTRYDIRNETLNGLLQTMYSGALEDLSDIEAIIKAKPGLNPAEDKNKIAIAKILRVYTLQFVTDVFGPVPYKEALRGAINKTPAYESQEDIYMGLIDELHQALNQINLAEGSFAGADIVYGGDMMKWSRFGNALLMRIAIRLSDVAPSIAQQEFEFAASKSFADNSDNACFQYLVSPPNNFQLHQQRVERGDADFGLSKLLIDNTLKVYNDPRLLVWADERVKGGGYFGRPYGQSDGNAAGDYPENYSQPSGSFKVIKGINRFNAFDIIRPDALSCFLGYAEVCFMLAEAKERNWNVPGTAQEWYNKGIAASMNEWGIADQVAIDSYLNQTSVDYNTAPGDWKQKIGVQKWLALFMQGFQAWIEWRRLDFIKLQLPVDGVLGDIGNHVAPVRLVYPSDELSLNASNYEQAIILLGGPDKLSTRVWWDVK
jgi:hypothetical protein